MSTWPSSAAACGASSRRLAARACGCCWWRTPRSARLNSRASRTHHCTGQASRRIFEAWVLDAIAPGAQPSAPTNGSERGDSVRAPQRPRSTDRCLRLRRATAWIARRCGAAAATPGWHCGSPPGAGRRDQRCAVRFTVAARPRARTGRGPAWWSPRRCTLADPRGRRHRSGRGDYDQLAVVATWRRIERTRLATSASRHRGLCVLPLHDGTLA